MFGYIKASREKSEGNEFGLYHAFFCAICISSKEQFGFRARMLTNFDMAFFNTLFHSFLGIDVEVVNGHCITTPIKVRSYLKRDWLTDKLSQANIILSYVNLMDDVLDEKSFKKKMALAAVKPLYKKAKKMFPELDESILQSYRELTGLEKEHCQIFDKICHPFAELSKVFCKCVLGEKSNEYIENLCYNLGKWIYLVDALDDLEKDFKKKSYNPFISCFGDFTSPKTFVKDHLDDLEFIFYTTLNKIAESYNDLELQKYTCVLRNVLHIAIRDTTQKVFDKYLEENKQSEQSV